MAEKSTRDVKLKGFSAIAAIAIGSLLLIGGWVLVGSLLPVQRQAISELPEQKQSVSELVPPATDAKASVPASVLAQDASGDREPSSNVASGRQGVLRVGNLSDHPVRVALLLKNRAKSPADGRNENYEPPAHWDFAPGEGRTKGLLLSLPNRSIKVKPGDVLVAFAQDGSRRYWGPYVVGETATPDWQAGANEWELVLPP